MPPRLSPPALRAWQALLEPHANRGHVRRDLYGPTIESHVAACYDSAIATAERVRGLAGASPPKRALEVGSSAGLNCIALQAAFPLAEVVGIEPELEACAAARETAVSWGADRCVFVRGVGEHLPFHDGAFDLIVCHTVIEHVSDVEKVIREMARVLAPQGMITLEAPNYLWPREPHLGIWCIPLLGKASIKAMARLQGAGERETSFVDHLQLVHPRMLEQCFARSGLRWHNTVRDKIVAVGRGTDGVKAYRRIVPLLRTFDRLGLVERAADLALATRLHPRSTYTLTKA